VPGRETADSPGRRALGLGGPAEAAEGDCGLGGRGAAAVTGVVVVNRFRPDYSAHNAPGEPIAAWLRPKCCGT